MHLQTDKELNPIGTWGCYFMSLMKLFEVVKKETPSKREILRLWIESYEEAEIDLESTILKPEGILESLGLKVKFIGKAAANYVPMFGEHEICEWFNPRTGLVHFTYGQKDNPNFFDPLGKSITVKEGSIRSKRVYKVV